MLRTFLAAIAALALAPPTGQGSPRNGILVSWGIFRQERYLPFPGLSILTVPTGFFPMVTYTLDFVVVAQTFHLSLVVAAPHFDTHLFSLGRKSWKTSPN